MRSAEPELSMPAMKEGAFLATKQLLTTHSKGSVQSTLIKSVNTPQIPLIYNTMLCIKNKLQHSGLLPSKNSFNL